MKNQETRFILDRFHARVVPSSSGFGFLGKLKYYNAEKNTTKTAFLQLNVILEVEEWKVLKKQSVFSKALLE